LQILTIAQVRYVGVLSEVDPVNKAMTLINVKSYGTEGRRQGVNEIAASEAEIVEARFKVDHIKDFKIIEKPNPTLLDPAIISTETKAKPAAE
jgi:protein LSM14